MYERETGIIPSFRNTFKPEDRVKKVLNSLEGVQKAKAPHDGFSKIQQRLAAQRQGTELGHQSSRRAWIKVAAVIALVVSSNIWVVSNYLSSQEFSSEESSSYPQVVSNYNLYDDE